MRRRCSPHRSHRLQLLRWLYSYRPCSISRSCSSATDRLERSEVRSVMSGLRSHPDRVSVTPRFRTESPPRTAEADSCDATGSWRVTPRIGMLPIDKLLDAE